METATLISSIASTIMATVLAVVALVFSYRQNVGWKPLALVAKPTMSGNSGEWAFNISVAVEFWNRRKYPVALRSIRAHISGVDLDEVRITDPEDKSFVQKNLAYKEPDVAVPPNSSHEVVFQLRFKDQSLDALKPLFKFVVGYFDPRSGRDEHLTVEYKFFYPELGWRKSDEERSETMKAFDELRADYEARQEKHEARAYLKAWLKPEEASTGSKRAKSAKGNTAPNGKKSARRSIDD